jgi:hypothetical protein
MLGTAIGLARPVTRIVRTGGSGSKVLYIVLEL